MKYYDLIGRCISCIDIKIDYCSLDANVHEDWTIRYRHRVKDYHQFVLLILHLSLVLLFDFEKER
jgi:hypothetical protein